jgi:adenylylsulfate kinase-like enzyme
MIYWFTGQPCAGKTVLADMLKEEHLPNAFRIDGDDMRELFSNNDYSIKGRVENIATAQRIAHYLHNQGHDVIVSLVSPYIDQREDFKILLGDDIKEIYVHTTEIRERDHFAAIAYIPPCENYIDINTNFDTPIESLKKILSEI